MASTSISRTPSSTGNRQTWTFSAWVKRSELSTNQKIFEASPDGSNTTDIRLKTDDTLQVYSEVGGVTKYNLKTNRFLRDTNGWMHIVVAVDTTQGTSSNRVKLYINGVQETSLNTATYPDQNFDTLVNYASQINVIGRRNPYSDFYFNGLISYAALVDGTQELPTIFGETDSVTGEWKIKTDITPSVAWGTNGFLILKNGNSLTDESTNTNNFTLGSGVLTKTEDCPDNVFCTINPLNSYWAGGTFVYGNNVVTLPNKNGAWNTGTLGMTSGKFYWEIRTGGDSNGAELQIGIADKSPIGNSSGSTAGTSFGYNSNGEYGIYAYNGAFIGNGVSNPYTSYGTAAAGASDYTVMIAVDLDNSKFYAGINGTWYASGNPSTGTNGKTIQAVADTQDGCYYPAVGTYQGYSGQVTCNFGNGYFADNAVADAGTNASGNGIFEYDVPTGYTALSTKGLNL